MDLWRAAKDDYLDTPCSFAARREDAEEYMRNRGYGGPRLYRVSIEAPAPERVLDLVGLSTTKAILAIVEACGWDPETDHPGAVGPEEWVMWQTTANALVERGYRWVRVTDSYPEGCETWTLLQDDDCDVEDAMEEVAL